MYFADLCPPTVICITGRFRPARRRRRGRDGVAFSAVRHRPASEPRCERDEASSSVGGECRRKIGHSPGSTVVIFPGRPLFAPGAPRGARTGRSFPPRMTRNYREPMRRSSLKLPVLAVTAKRRCHKTLRVKVCRVSLRVTTRHTCRPKPDGEQNTICESVFTSVFATTFA